MKDLKADPSARRLKSSIDKPKHATSRSKTPSQKRWLERQWKDQFVVQAKKNGYRSRAYFKLKEMNEHFSFIKEGYKVLDLGAAPGGWSQYARLIVGETGYVLAVDLLMIEPIAGVHYVQGTIGDESTQELIRVHAKGGMHVVMSDMAANMTGHKQTDYLRTLELAELSIECALGVLTVGGTFLTKVLQGGTEHSLLQKLKSSFKKVHHLKPQSSRKDSRELYVLALGFHQNKSSSL